MPLLNVGKTIISYTILRSDFAKRKRIVITPNRVEVIAPSYANEQEIIAFMHVKRRWVYDKWEEIQEKLAVYETDAYERLRSGAKIPYRGRNLILRVHHNNDNDGRIEFKNGFHVYLPQNIDQVCVERDTGQILSHWLKKHLREDVSQLARQYCAKLDLNYKYIEVRNLPKLWGSCTPSGHIKINWHLVAAPKPVIEYVVLHEICHRKHRNHSPAFWKLLATVMPDYLTRKKWLETANPYFKL